MGAGNSGLFRKTYGAKKSMPYCIHAKTPIEKFVKYSLDYDNLKASGKPEAYERGLGYTKNNCNTLIKQIHQYVVKGNSPYEIQETDHGTKYKFRIPITGPNGLTKKVIAVYQIDRGTKVPILITNYLEKEKKQ